MEENRYRMCDMICLVVDDVLGNWGYHCMIAGDMFNEVI